jgi:hypothetical protein
MWSKRSRQKTGPAFVGERPHVFSRGALGRLLFHSARHTKRVRWGREKPLLEGIRALRLASSLLATAITKEQFVVHTGGSQVRVSLEIRLKRVSMRFCGYVSLLTDFQWVSLKIRLVSEKETRFLVKSPINSR